MAACQALQVAVMNTARVLFSCWRVGVRFLNTYTIKYSIFFQFKVYQYLKRLPEAITCYKYPGKITQMLTRQNELWNSSAGISGLLIAFEQIKLG